MTLQFDEDERELLRAGMTKGECMCKKEEEEEERLFHAQP